MRCDVCKKKVKPPATVYHPVYQVGNRRLSYVPALGIVEGGQTPSRLEMRIRVCKSCIESGAAFSKSNTILRWVSNRNPEETLAAK